MDDVEAEAQPSPVAARRGRAGGTRLAAGPGGPRSLQPGYAAKTLATIESIRRACGELIEAGRYPSINAVVEAGGTSRTNLNRPRYKALLKEFQFEFDARWRRAPAANETTLGVRSSDKGDPCDDPGHAASSSRARASGSDERFDRLVKEVERRDGQLYHALGVARDLTANLRWHRRALHEANEVIASLTGQPLPKRERREWPEEERWFDDDDDA